jgi:putative PEP-CTERM system histidine kinase
VFDSPVPVFSILSFISAAIAYLAVLAVTLPSHPGTRQASALIAAIGVSALWGVVLSAAIYAERSFSTWMVIPDAVRLSAWIFFVAWVLRAHARTLAATMVVAAVSVCVLVALAVISAGFYGRGEGKLLALSMLGLPLVGLLGLEQLFRNSVFEQRKALKPLCLAIGGAFAIDVFVNSQALLFARINEDLWALRGYANVATAPLLLLAIKQQPGWGQDVFVSRHVVFYTTSLVVVGLYLLAMAAGGFLIAATGAEWGPPLQLAFFACAGVALVYLLFSVGLRRRLKVFISKHFYRNRYDYREEWLRLMETLAGTRDDSSLPERSIRALADIIGSEGGQLWLADRTSTRYEPSASWRMLRDERVLERHNALIGFMKATHWVIDTQEYQAQPEKYWNAFAAEPREIDDSAILVPLVQAGELIGVVSLQRPAGLGGLSYEDHDLLKTAGQQVAIFLQQERARDELSETRQFEAFSKLTAFLMHDLKNLIAQQELVVANAQRFKHRPEFIEDAVKTIEGGVQRMRKVLDRLQSAGKQERPSIVDLNDLVSDVCRACSDRRPSPQLGSIRGPVHVAADREKLHMALLHAVRNAQDATPTDGRIDLTLSVANGAARIEVADTGCGMDPEFVRSCLFKPFQSTKGAKGMGIGAYQLRETLRAAGGDVEVVSVIGEGTTLRMRLPLSSSVSSRVGQSAA